MRHVLASLARRWLMLHEEIKIHSRHVKALTKPRVNIEHQRLARWSNQSAYRWPRTQTCLTGDSFWDVTAVRCADESWAVVTNSIEHKYQLRENEHPQIPHYPRTPPV